MSNFHPAKPAWLLGGGTAAAATLALLLVAPFSGGPSKAAPPQARAPLPVTVASVEERDVALWSEFSGRLEAVERVEIRPRVPGAVHAVHFREGGLVKQGDLLVTIDPAPYAAEVERAAAQVASAESRVELTKREHERSQQLQLTGSSAISQSTADQRKGAYQEAEAALLAAKAALETARLNLGYTQVRAPVAGRVGKLEITVGNLVAAGPGTQPLTTLVSVDPIYASFSADEDVVVHALKSLASGIDSHAEVGRIPVEILTSTFTAPVQGRLQLVDNQVDAKSGTIRVRAVFANERGELIPGQFARIRMGQATTQAALLVSERAIGTDQNKKFVMIVDETNRVAYREVALGASVDGLRFILSGLRAGERVIVNGLQRVQPGDLVAPQLDATASIGSGPVTER
jgi:membrane fusion protein, multidrug efflux system